jgi:hypothetical protein
LDGRIAEVLFAFGLPANLRGYLGTPALMETTVTDQRLEALDEFLTGQDPNVIMASECAPHWSDIAAAPRLPRP